MLIDPTGAIMGMDVILPYFQKLPFADILFQNYLFSGFSLLIVNGLSNLVAATLLILSIFKDKKLASDKKAVIKSRLASAVIFTGTLFGLTLMLWICIQFYMFPPNSLDTFYFIFGFLQFVTGFACFVFYRQETMHFDESEFPNIGSNKDEQTLVVYFSRLGRTKLEAYKEADKLGADILELTSPELTEGTLGFWWCGRYGMHRWNMPLNDYSINWNKYDKVVICTPVWVFHVAPPIKQFVSDNVANFKRVSYIVVHFNPFAYKSVVKELDYLNGKTHEYAIDVCTQHGKTRKVRTL